MLRAQGMRFMVIATMVAVSACAANPDDPSDPMPGDDTGDTGSGDSGDTGSGSGTGSGTGNGTGTGSGSGSGSGTTTGTLFRASIDSGAQTTWTLTNASYGPAYNGNTTWVRGKSGNGTEMIDIMFGTTAPALGNYKCYKSILPSSSTTSFIYWSPTGGSYFTECGPDVQPLSCDVTIVEASGATGRLRGTFTASVGCPGVEHHISGDFSVVLPFTAP